MNIEQAYLQFLQLVNRNITDDNVDIDKSKFILLYNSTQNKYVEWILEKRNDDSLRDIQNLLELDYKLLTKVSNLNHFDFKLPDNYFDHSSLQVYGSNGECKNQKIEVHEIKNDDVESYIIDEYNKPSFEYRETFYTLNNNKVAIYVDGFDIDNVYLSYYRKPIQVDIAGYITLDNRVSVNINPEFQERVVQKILTAMAKEFSANTNNQNKYQLDKDRLFNKI